MSPKLLKRDTDYERDARRPTTGGVKALDDGASAGSEREMAPSSARVHVDTPRKAWLLTWLLAGTTARLKLIDCSFFAILCGPERRALPG